MSIAADDEIDITSTLIDINGAVDMSSTLGVTGVVTANAGVVVDNFTLDGTTLALSSGDFTLDVEADILLNANGDNIKLLYDDTIYLDIYKTGNNIALFQAVSDGDILFQGTDSDGGGAITALTLDMSEAGTATFNHDVKLPSAGNLFFTSGSSFSPRLSNSNSDTALSFFTNNTERFQIATDGGLHVLTPGTSNVRLGVNAGDSIVSGANENVLIGDEAGTSLVQHGINNTAVGFSALKFEDTHGYNTAIGWSTLKNLDAGANGYNTAVGADAGRGMSEGVNNTLVGAEAGHDISTGTGNTFLGVQAGDKTDDGANNVAVGFGAGGGNCGNNNVFVGEGAAIAATGGTNTIVGSGAGGNASFAGSGNTTLGRNAGAGITSGSNNIVIGNGADVNSAAQVNGITLGVGIVSTANQFAFGKASNVVTNTFTSNASFSRSSDERLKTNISSDSLGLDFINDLRTVKYKWKSSQDLDADDAQLSKLYNADENQMDTDVVMHGLIAQEVKAALDTAGVDSFNGWSVDSDGVQQVSREMYVIPLIKAVQELSTALDAALARIATLEG